MSESGENGEGTGAVPSSGPTRSAGAVSLLAALGRSEPTLQALMDAAADGFMVADGLTERILYANQAMVRLLQRSGREMVNLGLHEIHPPGDYARVRDLFQCMVRGESSFAADVPVLRSDGSIVRFDVKAVPLEIEGRLCLLGIFRDISAVHVAQQELAESERRLRTLLANLPGMAYRCRNDRDWTMVFCSEGSQDLIGVTPDEFLSGRAAYNDFIHPEDRDRVWNEVQSALAEGRPFQLRYRLRARGGEERHAWEQGRGVHDRDGTLQALEGIVMDVTDMVRSEERVRALNQGLELAMLETRSMVFENDLVTGDPGLKSTALFEAMGYEGDEIPRTMEALTALVHPADMAGVWEAIERHARGETPVYYAEYRARAKDGSWWWIAGTGTITKRTPEGRPHKLVGMATSLQERHLAEEERRNLLARESAARRDAENAVRIREEFISVAAHELKTPVATLQIALERLKNSAPGSLSAEAVTRSLEIADRQAQRLVRLVNGLLDLTRLSTGRFELQRTTFDLADLVREVVSRDEAMLALAGCVVEDAGLESVTGSWDRDRLDQVVDNLLVNASKFGRGQPIHVSVRGSASQALLSVTDHGIGIAPGQEARIFEAYERGGSERHYGGLGMGLYISRAIIQSHGGTITAGNHPDGGAVFTVELPLG